MDPKERMRASLKAARDVTARATAQGRDMTNAEVEEAQAHLKSFEEAKKLFAKAQAGADLKSQLKAIGAIIDGDSEPSSPSPRGVIRAGQAKSAFRAKMTGEWAQKAAAIFQGVMNRPDGQKALTSGTIDVPSVIREPVEIEGRPTSLLQLIPTRTATGERTAGNAFSYLRQTTRTNNAAAVADNATKPTSVYTFADVEDTFRVYAHLSEVFPRRYLEDYAGLIDILQTQMGEGLVEALEDDILNGAVQPADGYTGILNTSGIQAQPWATDLLTTLSNARYALVNSFQTPTAWVLNPTDVQRLELMREDGTTGPLMFRKGLADIEEFLGGAPIVMNNLIPAGTGLVGDFNWTELIIREDDHLDVDTSGEKFSKNQVQFRLEGRYGFTVERPNAFVEIELEEPAG